MSTSPSRSSGRNPASLAFVPRVIIIINPISGPKRRGTGAERADVARRTLERLGAEGEIRLTERAGHAHELALEAAASGAELVIAWGGDGTINEVGRALVQRERRGSGRRSSGARDHSRRFRQRPRARAEHSIRSCTGDRAGGAQRLRGASMRASSVITCSSMSPASGSTPMSPPSSRHACTTAGCCRI